MKLRHVVILAAVAALGCNKATAPTGGISANCSVTLSGALSGTYDCRPATTLWAATDTTDFTFGVAASGTRPSIAVAILWGGVPTDSTYRNTDAGAEAELIVTTSAHQTWEAAVGPGETVAGSYGLTFTSVAQNGANAGGNGYDAEGTLDATLPAVTSTGASGVVLVSATF